MLQRTSAVPQTGEGVVLLISAAFALALAGSAVTGSTCSWDRPGHNAFTGDVVAAVDRYTDIAPDVRARLKERMARRDYDDMVSIQRDSIEGKNHYDPTIRDMYFGEKSMCRSVTRAAWAPQAQERGLVYCEGNECVLVPTVCRNVSRISRAPGGAAGTPVATAGAPPDELAFAPPGAGQTPSFATQSGGPAGGSEGPLSTGGGGGGPPIYTPTFPAIPGGFIPSSAATPVPEPATFVLWIAGLGLLGGPMLLQRGRRRRADSLEPTGRRIKSATA